ncbi:hypothetical protein ACWDKQ_00485 [Saccharopolyspora sp. NPDC000995]
MTTFGLAKLMSLPREYARFKQADPGLAGAWLTHVHRKADLGGSARLHHASAAGLTGLRAGRRG